LLGELQSDVTNNHWGTPSTSNNNTVMHTKPVMSTPKLLHQLLSTTTHKTTPAKIQDSSLTEVAGSTNISTCPACKKPKRLLALNNSHLKLCDTCIQEVQKAVKSEEMCNPGPFQNKPCTSSSTSNQELVAKKQDENPGCVVAHLVAIKSSTSSPSTSTVPLYVVIDGKAIPLTVAQVQSSSGNKVETNQSYLTSTAGGSATPCGGKNIKISPMPMTPNPGSCLMIAGIAPAVQVSRQMGMKKPTKPTTDDSLRTFACTYPNCTKRYFKSSHLKAHLR